MIGTEGVRSPAGLAGQVRPRRQSRGGSPPAPRSRAPGVESNCLTHSNISSNIPFYFVSQAIYCTIRTIKVCSWRRGGQNYGCKENEEEA